MPIEEREVKMLRTWLLFGIGLLICLVLFLPLLIFILQPPRLLAQIPGAVFFSTMDWGSGQKRIALTLDDGPDPHTTPEILQALAQANIPATFFLIGERAQRHPDLVRQIFAAGHEIGNHSYQEELSLIRGDFPGKLIQTEVVFAQILGAQFEGSQWVRPGGGFYSPQMVEAVRSNPQFKSIVLGSIFPFDTHTQSARFTTGLILQRIHPGAIIVLHDGKGKRESGDGTSRGARAAQVIRAIAPPLRHQGYQFVTLNPLLLPDHRDLESNVRP